MEGKVIDPILTWMMRAALISLERSRRRAARQPTKVAVTLKSDVDTASITNVQLTFSSGIVLDMSPALMRMGTPPSSVTQIHTRMQRQIFFRKKHLVYEESEVGFLVLEKLVVGVGVNFLGSIIEVEAVVQILLIGLRNHNQMLHYKRVRPPGV